MRNWKQRFYKSRAWKEMRTHVLLRDKYVCAECGEVIVDTPEVHHTVELTEENHTNPEISLNPDLLETLHHECHDIRHGRFGALPKETIVNDDLEIDYTRR